MTVEREQVETFLKLFVGGRIFTITFVKRTNGEKRVMNCRKGVTSHLRGGKLKYDPSQKRLLVVFDMKKRQYRTINLDTVSEIKANKRTYKVA